MIQLNFNLQTRMLSWRRGRRGGTFSEGRAKEGEGGVVNDGFALFVFCFNSTPNRHFLCHLGIHLILRHGNSPSRSIKSPRDLIGRRERKGNELEGKWLSLSVSLSLLPSSHDCSRWQPMCQQESQFMIDGPGRDFTASPPDLN